MTVITMGVHVLDVLVRPVVEIPQGQGAALVEDVRITAAGTAGRRVLLGARQEASSICGCLRTLGRRGPRGTAPAYGVATRRLRRH